MGGYGGFLLHSFGDVIVRVGFGNFVPQGTEASDDYFYSIAWFEEDRGIETETYTRWGSSSYHIARPERLRLGKRFDEVRDREDEILSSALLALLAIHTSRDLQHLGESRDRNGHWTHGTVRVCAFACGDASATASHLDF